MKFELTSVLALGVAFSMSTACATSKQVGEKCATKAELGDCLLDSPWFVVGSSAISTRAEGSVYDTRLTMLPESSAQ